MKRYIASLAAVVASGLFSSTDWAGVAVAQTPGTAGPISLGQLFEDETSAVLTQDGKGKLLDAVEPLHERAAGAGCRMPWFQVIVNYNSFNDAGAPGAPSWVLGETRQGVIETYLANHCGPNCNFGFQLGSSDEVVVHYTEFTPQDLETPIFLAESMPDIGTRVNPGDKIVVQIISDDQWNTWQTGTQSIGLTLESFNREANEYFVDVKEIVDRRAEANPEAQNVWETTIQGAAPTPAGSRGDASGIVLANASWQPVTIENCEDYQEGRMLQVTVTVPADPPPFMRFRATAKDFAGNEVSARAEFPTGILSGIWRDEAAGREVYLVQSDNNVEAYYVEQRACDHRNGTGNSTNTFFNFSGTVEDDRIGGETEVCTWGGSDAGWIPAPVKLIIASDWKSLSGEWYNALAQRWVPITYTWLRDN